MVFFFCLLQASSEQNLLCLNADAEEAADLTENEENGTLEATPDIVVSRGEESDGEGPEGKDVQSPEGCEGGVEITPAVKLEESSAA